MASISHHSPLSNPVSVNHVTSAHQTTQVSLSAWADVCLWGTPPNILVSKVEKNGSTHWSSMVVDTSMSGDVCKLVHSLMVTRSMSVTTTTSFLSSMVLLAVADTIDSLSLVQQTITTLSVSDCHQHHTSMSTQTITVNQLGNGTVDDWSTTLGTPTLMPEMCNPMPFNFAH